MRTLRSLALTLLAALPLAAFAQAAAPADFITAVEAGDVVVVQAMLAADPVLASSLDERGEPVAFLALASRRPADTLALLLGAGLSPATGSKASGRLLLVEAVYRGDPEAVRLVAQALASLGPDAWARPYEEARRRMDALVDMQRKDILAAATETSPRDADQDWIDRRATFMNKGREYYPEMRAAMAGAFAYPISLLAEAYGAFSLTLWPQTDSLAHEDDAKGGFVPSAGAAVSVFFVHGEVGFQGNQRHARPLWSLGAYVAGYAAMPAIGTLAVVAGGAEFDFMRLAYARLGGGYAFTSAKDMAFTVSRNVAGVGDEDRTYSVPLAGPVVDMSLGFRIPLEPLEISIAFPIFFRVGFTPLEGIEDWDDEVRQLYVSAGLSVGVGYALN